MDPLYGWRQEYSELAGPADKNDILWYSVPCIPDVPEVYDLENYIKF